MIAPSPSPGLFGGAVPLDIGLWLTNFVGRIQLGGGLAAWHAKLRVEVQPFDVSLRVETLVPSRDADRQTVAITYSESVPEHVLQQLAALHYQEREKHAMAVIQRVIGNWVQHELSESIRLDGELVHDPHAGGRI